MLGATWPQASELPAWAAVPSPNPSDLDSDSVVSSLRTRVQSLLLGFGPGAEATEQRHIRGIA